MYKFFRFSLILFGIVCITGCPQPDRLYIIDAGGDMAGVVLEDSNYKITISDMHPYHGKRTKEITVHVDIRNLTKDSLQLICSKSVIYSKSDTFTGQNYNDHYNSIYLLKDTITLAPGGFDWFDMLFIGNKKYTARLYKRANKSDTLSFHLNLFGKDTRTFFLRNHHNGGWAWDRY